VSALTPDISEMSGELARRVMIAIFPAGVQSDFFVAGTVAINGVPAGQDRSRRHERALGLPIRTALADLVWLELAAGQDETTGSPTRLTPASLIAAIAAVVVSARTPAVRCSSTVVRNPFATASSAVARTQ
jgi:hypothetical protein